MPDPTLRPPDMVGAGAYQQPQDPASLIGLLRSQGSLPAEAMMSMMGPAPSASPLASAILGGVAMMPGQTGAQQAVQMNQQQAQFQQQQQMQQAQLMQRINEMKQRAAEHQESRYDALIDTLLKAPDRRSRAYGAQMLGASAKRLGYPIPPAPLQGLSTMSDAERLSLFSDIRSPFSDEYLMTQYGLSPEELKQYKAAADSDVISRRLGVPTKAEAEVKALEFRNKTSDTWLAEHPEFDKDNLAIAAQLSKSRYGVPLMHLDNATKINDVATEATKIADQKKIKLAEARARATEGSNLPVAPGQRWLDLSTGQLVTPTKQQFASEPSRYRTLSPQGERLYDLLPTAYPNLQRLDELIDLLLPSHGPQNIVNGLRGHASKALRQDPNWLQFYALSADTNIELAAALSPGQFRSQLLVYLQHSIGLSPFDTQAGAHRLTHTLRVQIGNRLTGITAGGGLQSIPSMTTPGLSPQEQAAKPAITKEQYQQLLKKPGVTDAMIREKYQVQ